MAPIDMTLCSSGPQALKKAASSCILTSCGKVLLLFSVQARTDDNGTFEEFLCAFVSVLETMGPRDADRYESLHKQGSRLLYELDPEVMHLSLRKRRKAAKLHNF